MFKYNGFEINFSGDEIVIKISNALFHFKSIESAIYAVNSKTFFHEKSFSNWF